MRAPESYTLLSNQAAVTSAAITVYGGRYLVLFDCIGTPSLQLEMLNISTVWDNVGAAFVTDGGGSFEIGLPPGQVRVVVSTSTANTVTLSRIPND